jgi:pimeloyl-ACP methyl ester carboxylesterase
MSVTRGFLDVRGRTVHYRRGGAGPALVLLHGSPNSSLSLEPLIEILSASFDCIAFDTPGNGDSDALAHDAPMTEDYAQALAEAVNDFGLTRFSLYGFHTGAGTAAEYAARNPERVASLVLDGVAAWTAEEKAVMLEGYLPPFLPQWGGAHLAWLWSRIVDQTMFFPWHRPSRATRMNYDMPEPETLHRTAMEFLRSGDNYRKPYAAALAGDGAARVRRLSSPTLVTAHPMDPIAHHLDRLSDYAPCVVVRKETQTDKREIWESFAAYLRAHPGDPAPAPPVGGKRRFAATPFGQVALRVKNGAGRPLLLLHDAGGSSALFANAFDAARAIIAPDLPGHGESAAPMPGAVSDAADAVESALKNLGVNDAAAAGFGLGGLVACALKRRGRVSTAALIGAPRTSTSPPPDLSPRLDGGHLLAAWHFVRLRTLYLDWSRRDHRGVAWTAPALAPAYVHQRALDLLKCENRHAKAFAAEFDRDNIAAAADALYLPECDPAGLDEAAARVDARLPRRRLPGAPTDWGAALAAFGE